MSKIRKVFGFVGLVLAMFMGALDATIVNIALPDIMKHLNSSLTDTSWVSTIYVLAMAAFIITASKLADLYGRRLVMLICVAIFGVFSLACMMANSLSFLIAFRFFQGIGGAILTPIVLPMGIALFGKANTSKVTAIIGAFSALAAASGPVIGGFIINWASYNWIFGINIPIALISFVLILVGNEESYDFSIAKEIDWLGMVFLTCSLGGLTFGLLEGREYGWTSTIILSSFAISLVGLILLVFVEEKVKSPIIELSLFKEKIFTASSIIYMIFGFAIIVPSLILNYFLQNVRGYSSLHSAYLIVPTSLAIALGMPLATKMYQKLSAKLLIGIGMFITAAGLFMLSLVQFETSEAIIICCNVIIGLGLGFMVMSMTASVRYLPVIKAGIGSGIVDASRYIGQEIGMVLLVTILNANINTARDNIRHYAYVQIDKHVLSDSVKSVVKMEIKEIFESTSKTTDSSKKQNQMLTKVKAAAKKTDNLPLPKKGSDYRKLYDANSQLVVGSEKVVANLPKQISSALTPLSQGQAQLGQGIQLLAQKEELTDTFQKIKDSKNKNLSRAFNQVFIIASLIVLITSPLAYLTDKKVKE